MPGYVYKLLGQWMIFLFLLFIWIYKSNEVFNKKTKYYPKIRMYLGLIILLILFIVLAIDMLEIFGIYINISTSIGNYLIIIMLIIVLWFLSLGTFPTPVENRFNIEIDYSFITRRGGIDLLDTPIIKVDGYLLLYKYFIDFNTIEVLKNTPEVIVIRGISNTKKYGNLQITARFYSKLSRKRISGYLELSRSQI